MVGGRTKTRDGVLYPSGVSNDTAKEQSIFELQDCSEPLLTQNKPVSMKNSTVVKDPSKDPVNCTTHRVTGGAPDPRSALSHDLDTCQTPTNSTHSEKIFTSVHKNNIHSSNKSHTNSIHSENTSASIYNNVTHSGPSPDNAHKNRAYPRKPLESVHKSSIHSGLHPASVQKPRQHGSSTFTANIFQKNRQSSKLDSD